MSGDMGEPVEVEAAGGAVETLRALHRLAVAVHGRSSSAQFYDETLDVVVSVLGVERASLLLFDPDGVMRFKGWRGLSHAYRRAVEGHTPWSPADVDAVPIVVPDVFADDELKHLGPVFEAEGIRAVAFVPLIAGPELVGKFMLYYDRPHECSPAELAAAELVAAHVSLAVDGRRTEAALRDSEQRFRRLIATSTDAFIAVDADCRITEWNHQAELTFGWRRDEVLGLNLDETIIPPRYREAHRQGLARYLATGEGAVLGKRLELEGQRRDGSEFPAELSIWSLDVAPAVTFNSLVRDITERRAREESERAAREEAETAAARLARLQRVTAELSRATTVDDVAAVVLGTLVSEMGATSASLCLSDGDDLEIAYAVGYPDEVMTHWRRFPIDAPLPASDAVRTGQAIFLSSPEERDRRYPVFAAAPVVAASAAFAMVPLVDEGSVGCLVLGFPEPRQFADQDESFFFVLAARCTAALERARLFDEQRHRQARAALVAEVAAGLATSFDPDQTLAAVARAVVPGLADACAIHLYGEARTAPRLVAVHHHDPDRVEAVRQLLERYPPRLRQPGAGRGASRRPPVAVHPVLDDDVIERVATTPEHAALLRAGRFGSGLVVTLTVRGRAAGALSLVNDEGRALDPDTVSMAEEIAGRLGVAIDNGRLFRERTAIATTLQASLLPPDLPAIPGLDVAARYTAGGSGIDVGGDFYDLFAVDQGRHVFVLGDVCGRGVQAATVAALTRHTIRSAAVTAADPAAILAHTNDVLLRSQPADVPEPRFCTAVVGVLTPEAGGFVLDLAVGGHPLPVLHRADGSLAPIGASGSVLGVMPGPPGEAARVRLEPGDAVVAVTDGILEARRGQEEFGDEGLGRVLAGAPTGDAAALAAAIEAAAVEFAAGPISDDLAILVLRAR
jgi:PAS domain S-box-containing protein